MVFCNFLAPTSRLAGAANRNVYAGHAVCLAAADQID